MEAAPQIGSERARKAILAAGLTWTAGLIDALGYLRLAGLYVANMSGNSVGMGLHGALGQAGAVLTKASPIIGFFAGLFITAVFLDWARHRGWIRRIAVVLAMEIALLVAFGLMAGSAPGYSDRWFYVLVALASVAMGLQNSALLHFGALTVYTTHVTGLLTRLAHSTADSLFWMRDHRRKYPTLFALWRGARREGPLKKTQAMFGLWTLYVVGAIVGAFSEREWGGYGVFIGCAVLLALLALDWTAPVKP